MWLGLIIDIYVYIWYSSYLYTIINNITKYPSSFHRSVASFSFLLGPSLKTRICVKLARSYKRLISGGGRSIIGGANIQIFVFTDLENNGILKKLITQNMNIWILAPPIINLPPPLVLKPGHEKCSVKIQWNTATYPRHC